MSPKRKSRKRVRQVHLHKQVVQKQKVENGESHTSRSGRIISAKRFITQLICRCNRKCAIYIDVERQQVVFSQYYNLINWTSKTLYLRGCVIQVPIKDNINVITSKKLKTCILQYKFLDSKGVDRTVCQSFFSKCLQVTSGRIQRAIQTFKSNPIAVDCRGKKEPAIKTAAHDKRFLKQFIEKFPRYMSHYGRQKSQMHYLAPNLNITKMYKEYEIVCHFHERKVLSEHMFRDIFNKEYNLSFKRRKTDTCKRCDELDRAIKDSKPNELDKFEKEKTSHLNHVKKVKSQYIEHIKAAKESEGETHMLVFDLQKTLETPSLSTSVIYYKRQLWTYNLCIYDEVKKQAFMYVWNEGEANRGADQIGSCLIKHILNNVEEHTKKIILYSDKCGGQNRNIKLSLLLKRLLCFEPNLQEIQQHFFVSGHSTNDCDRSFALIEKQKKFTQDIFTTDHWMNVIRQAKKKEPKFVVTRMIKDDFYSSENLKKLIVNRKFSVQMEKINWLNIESIIYKKEHLFSLYIKNNRSSHTFEINLQKKNVTAEMFIDEEVKKTSPKFISEEKYKDLLSILNLIPKKYHDFFKNLPHTNQIADINDDGLASASDISDNDIEN